MSFLGGALGVFRFLGNSSCSPTPTSASSAWA